MMFCQGCQSDTTTFHFFRPLRRSNCRICFSFCESYVKLSFYLLTFICRSHIDDFLYYSTQIEICQYVIKNFFDRISEIGKALRLTQGLLLYSVPKVYAVIVACAIMMKWTCTERILCAPIDYGLLAQLIHFSVCTPSINENINVCKIAITLICCHSDGKTKFLGSPHSFFGGVFEH